MNYINHECSFEYSGHKSQKHQHFDNLLNTQSEVMGCVTGPQDSVHINHPHISRYLMIMRLDHPLNVNKKYEHICKIIPNQSVGQGSRRTCAYECLVTEGEFHAKRKEFWGSSNQHLETRTSGEKTCWQAIQLALESDNEGDLRAILESAGLRPLQNSVQMCIDEKSSFGGNVVAKYEIPIFCINMPKTFSKMTMAQNHLDKNFEQKPVSVKIRSTRFITDATINTNTSVTIQELKNSFRTMQKLADGAKIRLFYKGREMMDQFFVGNYAVRDSDVIQAMITGG